MLHCTTGAQPFAFAPPAGYTAVAAAWSTQHEVPAVDTKELLALAAAAAAQDDALSTVAASELSLASDTAASTPAAAAAVVASNGSSSSSSGDRTSAASATTGSLQVQEVEVVGNLRVPPSGPIDLSMYSTASDLHMFGLERCALCCSIYAVVSACAMMHAVPAVVITVLRSAAQASMQYTHSSTAVC